MAAGYRWGYGDIVNDRYLIDRELGGGAIGHVYLAHALHLNKKRVVLKILKPVSAEKGWHRIKFDHEREALSRLDHPAIISLIDAGTTSTGESYLVLPYVVGRSLLDVMDEAGRLPLLWIGQLIQQIAHALSAAHDKGVIHRDIKPANILLQDLGRGEEQIRIVDFGLVGLRDPEVEADDSNDYLVVGTVPYMTPWPWQEDDLSAARDTYALGIITYELITGQPPFYEKGSTLPLLALYQEIWNQQGRGVRVAPKALRSDLPDRAQAAIIRALSFEQEDNFSQTRDFGDELMRALVDEPRSIYRPLSPPVFEQSTAPAPGTECPPAPITLAGFSSVPAASSVNQSIGSTLAEDPGWEHRESSLSGPPEPEAIGQFRAPNTEPSAQFGVSNKEVDWPGSADSVGHVRGGVPTGSGGPSLNPHSHFFEHLVEVPVSPQRTTKQGRPRPDITLSPGHSSQNAINDAVDCTVFAPPNVSPSETFLVQVFAHRPDQAETAQKEAQEFDESAQKRGFKSLEVEIERGTKIVFHLTVPGLTVDDPIQSMVWRGVAQPVQFGVTVPHDKQPGAVIGTVTVSQDHFPIGHIKFKLTVTKKEREVPDSALPLGDVAHMYKKAFISYASPDRSEVLKRVQIMSRLGIKFFQDVLDLEPGARWEKELYRHIDESDLFLLFWSDSARQSKWVMEEVRYALKLQGDDHTAPPELIPVILQGPPPPAPPEELSHLHFNDYFIYFINES